MSVVEEPNSVTNFTNFVCGTFAFTVGILLTSTLAYLGRLFRPDTVRLNANQRAMLPNGDVRHQFNRGMTESGTDTNSENSDRDSDSDSDDILIFL